MTRRASTLATLAGLAGAVLLCWLLQQAVAYNVAAIGERLAVIERVTR